MRVFRYSGYFAAGGLPTACLCYKGLQGVESFRRSAGCWARASLGMFRDESRSRIEPAEDAEDG